MFTRIANKGLSSLNTGIASIAGKNSNPLGQAIIPFFNKKTSINQASKKPQLDKAKQKSADNTHSDKNNQSTYHIGGCR